MTVRRAVYPSAIGQNYSVISMTSAHAPASLMLEGRLVAPQRSPAQAAALLLALPHQRDPALVLVASSLVLLTDLTTVEEGLYRFLRHCLASTGMFLISSSNCHSFNAVSAIRSSASSRVSAMLCSMA